MVTDYFFDYPYFFQYEEKKEKIFWDMEIIGNRRKMIITTHCSKGDDDAAAFDAVNGVDNH